MTVESREQGTQKPRRGDTLEVQAERIDERGGVRGRSGDFRVLLEGALPGERVRAEVLWRRRDQLGARAVERLTASPARVAPRCAHFGACGGCSYQDLDYAAQLEAKRELARALLAHAGIGDVPVEAVAGAREIWGYRNKMDFSFSSRRWIEAGEDPAADDGFALGLHPRGFFGKVIDVRRCEIQFEEANAILADVRELAHARGLEPWDIRRHTGLLRHLVLRQSRATGEILVNLVTASEAPESARPLAAELLARRPRIATLVLNVHSTPAQAALSEREIVLHGPGFVRERIAGLWFRLSANSFFQTNSAQAEELFRAVAEEAAAAADDVVWDLYCGAGAFALHLARSAREVLGVELAPSAVLDARENALANGIANARFVAADLARPLGESAGDASRATLCVVDPPRAGVHPRLLAQLAAMDLRRIVYVSCNLAAAARDARLLGAAGWRVSRVRPFDLFPHTPHLECVLTLERAA